MDEMIKWGVVIGLFLASIFLAGLTDSYQHERAHVKIMEASGCLQTEINIGIYPNPSTAKCLVRGETRTLTEEEKLHLVNEMISYNIEQSSIVSVICSLFLGIIIILKDT